METGNRQKDGTREKEQQPRGVAEIFQRTQERKAFGGFPSYNVACLLDFRKIKLLANILAGSICRLLLPVDYYRQHIPSQCPALHFRVPV